MLSSTARNLYWLARYIERAENTARVLEATTRMALLSRTEQEWRSVPAIYGVGAEFSASEPDGRLERLLEFMTFNEDNPSSIYSCIRSARNNAREERNNLTVDVWENLNGAWLEVAAAARRPRAGFEYGPFLDWVRKQAHLVTGAAHSTLLRDDAFCFVMLGCFVERADNTARILDVKYHILLPKGEPVGGSLDYFQWIEILACVSAYRTYRRVYSSQIEPWRIAELLILRRDLPRSLHFCLREIDDTLGRLAEEYGARGEANRVAGELHAQLRYARIETIFSSGLHEFLTGFVARNGRLSEEIAHQFLLD